MAHSLDNIIEAVLSSDSERIRQGEVLLAEAHRQQDTVWKFCEIITSNRAAEIRQLSAILLEQRLRSPEVWKSVPEAQQTIIKQGMIRALVEEKHRLVKNGIAKLVGTVIRHEAAKKDQFLDEVVKYIFQQCSLQDQNESELGSRTFSTLADVAPDEFMVHIDPICHLFESMLVNANMQNNLITNNICQMFLGMISLTPFLMTSPIAEETMAKSLPLMMKTMIELVRADKTNEFSMIFEIFDSIAEYSPKLFHDVRLYVNFCMEFLRNFQLDRCVRIGAVSFLGSLVRVEKRKIVKLALVEPIIEILFEMMCHVSDIAESEESELGIDEVVTSATQTLDVIAICLPADKFMPQLLERLEPALQHPDPLRRRSAYLCIGVVAEGCAEAICQKYLETMLSVIKVGINDPELLVRLCAFFALGQFSQFLYPHILEHSTELWNIIFEFLHNLLMHLRAGQPEPKQTNQMFRTLEVQCESLQEKVLPNLPKLMEYLFAILNLSNSVILRADALSVIASASMAAKGHMTVYLPNIVDVVRMYLVKDCEQSLEAMRLQTIHTWAIVVRYVGGDIVVHLANDSTNYCLMMLTEGPDDPELRRALYSLLGALSIVLKENMSCVFPKIMDRILFSVISHQDEVRQSQGYGSDDDDDFLDIGTEFAYEKEEALGVLKEFSSNTGAAFIPYLPAVFENVFKIIEHPRPSTRKMAMTAISEFICAYNRLGEKMAVAQATTIAITKFSQLLCTDGNPSVVNHLIGEMDYLCRDLRNNMVPTNVIRELVFRGIRKLLAMETNCQCNNLGNDGFSLPSNDGETISSELDESILENASELFTSFGYVVEPAQYSVYFARVVEILGETLNKTKQPSSSLRRVLVYGTISEALKHLGSFVDTFFDMVCPIFLSGVNDPDPAVRQNCYFGMGELILHGEAKSLQYCPLVLEALSESIPKEHDPSCMDYICGAVARLLIDNHKAFQLEIVLPVLLAHLPLRNEYHENDSILQAFNILYEKSRNVTLKFLDPIIKIVIHIVREDQMPVGNESAIEFIRTIRQQYPDKLEDICKSNPDTYNFVLSL